MLPESLSGLIERVTFFNEDTGFGVLKVKAKGHRDVVTVVGSLPEPRCGGRVFRTDVREGGEELRPSGGREPYPQRRAFARAAR